MQIEHVHSSEVKGCITFKTTCRQGTTTTKCRWVYNLYSSWKHYKRSQKRWTFFYQLFRIYCYSSSCLHRSRQYLHKRVGRSFDEWVTHFHPSEIPADKTYLKLLLLSNYTLNISQNDSNYILQAFVSVMQSQSQRNVLSITIVTEMLKVKPWHSIVNWKLFSGMDHLHFTLTNTKRVFEIGV